MNFLYGDSMIEAMGFRSCFFIVTVFIYNFAGSTLLSDFHGVQLTKLSQINACLCNGNVKMSKIKVSSDPCFRMEQQEKEKEPPGTHTSVPEECKRSSLNKPQNENVSSTVFNFLTIFNFAK